MRARVVVGAAALAALALAAPALGSGTSSPQLDRWFAAHFDSHGRLAQFDSIDSEWTGPDLLQVWRELEPDFHWRVVREGRWGPSVDPDPNGRRAVYHRKTVTVLSYSQRSARGMMTVTWSVGRPTVYKVRGVLLAA